MNQLPQKPSVVWPPSLAQMAYQVQHSERYHTGVSATHLLRYRFVPEGMGYLALHANNLMQSAC